MAANPYSPPRSAVASPEAPVRRPHAVLGLQAALLLVFVVYTTGFLLSMQPILHTLMQPGLRMLSPLAFIGVVALRVLALAAMMFIFWAVTTRRSFGRWLGAIFLVALAGLVLHETFQPAGQPSLAGFAYAGDTALADVMASVLAFFIIAALLAWAWAVAFSAGARRYFGGADARQPEAG